MRRGLGRCAAAFAACLIGLQAEASCRVALLLAVDVSSSVDEAEHNLQRDGLADALRSQNVVDTILNGPGEVALAVYEWSGRRQHRVVVDWTMLLSEEDVVAVADSVEAAPRSHADFPTAMGYAMGFGHTMMRRAPDCARQVIDVSGDGVTNDGFGPALAYKHFAFENITVNGLAIRGADPEVVTYYETNVMRGPFSFVEVAEDYNDFERAITRKLIRELSDVIVGSL